MYFEHISDFGEQMIGAESKNRIEVKHSNFNEKFYPDVDLDEKVVNQIVQHHLHREGFKLSAKQFQEETQDKSLLEITSQ